MKKYLIAILFVSLHVQGAEPVIINTPTGGQGVCIVSGSYITCY